MNRSVYFANNPVQHQKYSPYSTHLFPEPHLNVVLMEKLHPPQQNALILHIHDLQDGFQCVCVLLNSEFKKNATLIAKMLLGLYCVIYSAEPCWVGFCRGVKFRLWWPWWFCRQSFPAVKSQHRSRTQLLCLQRVNTTSHTIGKHYCTTNPWHTYFILFIFVYHVYFPPVLLFNIFMAYLIKLISYFHDKFLKMSSCKTKFHHNFLRSKNDVFKLLFLSRQ